MFGWSSKKVPSSDEWQVKPSQEELASTEA
jgi:hypothetical protein